MIVYFSICNNPSQTNLIFKPIQSILSHQGVWAIPSFISLIQAALVLLVIIMDVFFTFGITSLSPGRHSFWCRGIANPSNFPKKV